MSEPFIAEIKIFGGNYAPRSWAFCDGQLLPISQNTALFSIVGTTYGGDGRTTMGLPNMQGRAPMHPGRGPGLTDRRLGQKTGVETVTLSESQMPVHTHTQQAASRRARNEFPSATAVFGEASETTYAQGATVDMADQVIGSTGGSQSHNNMQPYLTLNFIIALQGLYPSRS